MSKHFNFTIYLLPTEEDMDDILLSSLENKFYNDPSEDATVGINCGRHYVNFTKIANSYEEAVASAVNSLKSIPNSKIKEIENDE